MAKHEPAKVKHEAFALEYVSNGYNQVKAYMTVYPNCTVDSAKRSSRNLMKDPEIKARIDELIKEKYDALHINAERIAEKLGEMAFADKEDEIYGPSVALKALDMLQKQLGLQKQQIKAEVDTKTIVVSIDDE